MTLSEPLSRAVPLLARGVEPPLLGLSVRYFRIDAIEPPKRRSRVTDAAPKLSDEIRQHRPLVTADTVEAFQRLLEFPRCLAPEESLGFDVALINATPCRP